MKPIVVIQGPINEYIYRNNLRAWDGWDVVYSTWEGSDVTYFDVDNFILNPIPKEAGSYNINLQKTSTLAGLKWGKERGYTHAIKMRSDMWPTNAKYLSELFSWNKLNFLCWHDHNGGYVTDYFMAGPIEDLETLWDVDIYPPHPEWAITQKIKEVWGLEKIHLILDGLESWNDVYWDHRGEFVKLSDYQKYNCYLSKI